ncbi:MAG TPA: hypothetical protein PLH22_00815 [Candidatus Colwellbacteria bacterium]|jgi:hypoxanthine phosphoribosyltransferase|nr:hypothetical protein [Candidatus Colwellbacteria bacterium]
MKNRQTIRSREDRRLFTAYKTGHGIWYDFNDIFCQTEIIAHKIKKISKHPIFISVGRGAWVFSRILCNFFENKKIKYKIFTVIASYINHNTSKERPILEQGLDNLSSVSIKELMKNGGEIWILDTPYITGRTALFVKKYIDRKFNTDSRIATLHFVDFKGARDFPWREKAIIQPNVYSEKISMKETMQYIEYPWEWMNLSAYNKVYNKYRAKKHK